MNEKSCSKIIEKVWSNGNREGSIEDIILKTKRCGVQLKKWNSSNFDNVQKCLSQAYEQLNQVQGLSPECVNVKRVSEAKKKGLGLA